jgi:RNA polymerase sigma factor (TIGR02999 family)
MERSMSAKQAGLTSLFQRLRAGDNEARDQIAAALYDELRRVAARRMRAENRAHTLQPTALVNEAYLRMLSGPDAINGRTHFFALAAQAMRRVLVDHARQKRADKRGGGAVRVTLEHLEGKAQADVDVLALEEALTELAKLDERAAKVVELRFFGGHTDKEVCELLGENLPRVRRDWEFARGWLRTRLKPLRP